jgi:hypothetical protein
LDVVMTDDDHVIPLEEALRRRRAREAQEEELRAKEAREEDGRPHEVRLSEAMTHLLEPEAAEEDGPSGADIRRIVECELIEERDDCFETVEEPPGEAKERPDQAPPGAPRRPADKG